mmetsp:Transcript_18757/g.26448  ORF Transcript_18757/g.26448 Transcript_18757/m.26448 type:complete len:412 (-) Transcript_18757:39-1274(-)|eukprot:CAMPEP_0171457868 /NCGR_PEP_ID=MMETSP0945-20130129/3770_1 /TAXON_ID=109269 /ORGANISM="Vaucheria litorea, Strain CCMP2940" /LENGTH=411 /DNA_ID=CAMNT_0011983553 /DNA_START=159 /DNA_END=1394 /DNA_ORIENTATION=-
MMIRPTFRLLLKGASKVRSFPSLSTSVRTISRKNGHNSRQSKNGDRSSRFALLLAAGVFSHFVVRNERSAHCELMREDSRSAMWPSKDRPKSGGLKIFSGNANPSLAKEIASYLGINLGKLTAGRFADGEVNVMVHENVRGKDVYIIQPTCMPVNENLVELLLMVSTMRRASARRITVVIPYYGYARQDRKMTARVPISAADVARLMEAMGVDRVVAVDLHCGQIQGFFGPRVPVDNLDGGIIGVGYFGDKDLHNPVVVSPDAGGVYRAKKFREGLAAKYDLDAGLAMIVKQRARANEIDRMDLVGSVTDSDVIIVDDMIDTAGTLCKAAEILKQHGARRVFAFASHGLFNGEADKRIAESALSEVVVLNTIPLSSACANNDKILQLSVAHLVAQAVYNIHNKKSISALFK